MFWFRCKKCTYRPVFTKLNENCGLPDLFTDYQIRHHGNPSGLPEILLKIDPWGIACIEWLARRTPWSMSSQSLKNLTIFNFAQISHAYSHPLIIEATVPHFRKIGQVFLQIRPPKYLKFYPKNCAWPLRRVSLWPITPVIIELGTWMIHFWKGLITHYSLDIQSVNYKYIICLYIYSWCDDLWPQINKIYTRRSDPK